MTKDGRISLAGLSLAKCEYLADAIIDSYHNVSWSCWITRQIFTLEIRPLKCWGVQIDYYLLQCLQVPMVKFWLSSVIRAYSGRFNIAFGISKIFLYRLLVALIYIAWFTLKLFRLFRLVINMRRASSKMELEISVKSMDIDVLLPCVKSSPPCSLIFLHKLQNFLN